MVFADYQVNRAELTRELCENVETDNNCQATCHLVKEVKKESPQSENLPFVPNKITKNELLYFENESPSIVGSKERVVVADNYQIAYLNEYTFGIFHPPKGLSL